MDLPSSDTANEVPAPVTHDSPEIELHTLAECQDALLQLLKATRRQLSIYSRDLEPQLIHAEPVLAELRRIATAGRGAQIRILLHDADAAVRNRAALIPLAQRMPSIFLLRRITEEVDLHYAGAFIVGDSGSVMLRPLGSRFEGGFVAHSAGRARQQLDYFNEVWERAVPATELRAGVV